MQPEETRTDLGAIRIHQNVISSIASLATLDIEGVKRVGGPQRTGIMSFLSQKDPLKIKTEFTKKQEVRIEIPIVIAYGYHIPEIAQRVQDNVRHQVERMTDLSIKDITVNVQAIEKG